MSELLTEEKSDGPDRPSARPLVNDLAGGPCDTGSPLGVLRFLRPSTFRFRQATDGSWRNVKLLSLFRMKIFHSFLGRGRSSKMTPVWRSGL